MSRTGVLGVLCGLGLIGGYALVYVLVNLLVDLSYAIIDPRVRLS